MGFASFFNYPGEAVAESRRPDDAVFLPDLDEEDWGRLLAYAETRRFIQGETVIPAGAADRSLYIVADGALELAGPDGTATVETGAVIGEMPFFDGRPHDTAIRAVTDVDLLALSPEAFEVLAAREPALARAVLFDLGRILSLRLRQASAFSPRRQGGTER